MSVKRFVRSLLLASALLGAIPVAATPAAAQGSGGECLEWGRNPATGEIICLAWSNTDPPPDGGGNGGGASGGGARAECVWGDTVIPCTRSDTAGVWSAGQSCYLAALRPSQRLSIRLGPGTTPTERSMVATTPTSLLAPDTWSSGSLTHPQGSSLIRRFLQSRP
jgi:hypothetical protein